MAVYGYCRVSTGRQADEGNSLEVQQNVIRGFAMTLGAEVTEFFVEGGVSGAKPVATRPEGSRLFAKLQAGDTIIASKLDRMFRSAVDALNTVEQLKKRGIKLCLYDLGGDISGNGLSKLFLTIAAAFAEAERDRIRERVTLAKADLRQRGRHQGGSRPFGYDIDGKGNLVPNGAEQQAIAHIRVMKAEGASLRAIAAAMAERGHSISHASVKRVLRDNP